MQSEEGPLVIGVTGSSGAPIAAAVVRGLADARAEFVLVLSKSGEAVLREETGQTPEALARGAAHLYADDDLAAPISSGSRRTRGMAIVPCSMNTLAKIAGGVADTLLTRAAHVHLKEHRRLVLVPRETPLGAIELGQMARLAELGVVMLVAAPPYYLHPTRVEEQVDFLAGKVLDHLGVPHHLYRGWKEGAA
jgi:flavin prenyltransferase